MVPATLRAGKIRVVEGRSALVSLDSHETFESPGGDTSAAQTIPRLSCSYNDILTRLVAAVAQDRSRCPLPVAQVRATPEADGYSGRPLKGR